MYKTLHKVMKEELEKNIPFSIKQRVPYNQNKEVKRGAAKYLDNACKQQIQV